MKPYSYRWFAYVAVFFFTLTACVLAQNSGCDLRRNACFYLFAQTGPMLLACIGGLFGYLWKFLSERIVGYKKETSRITLLHITAMCFLLAACASMVSSLRGLTN